MAFTAPDDELLQEEGFSAPDDELLMEDTGQSRLSSMGGEFGRSLAKVGTGTVEGLAQFGSSFVRNLNPVGIAAKLGVPGAQSLVDAYSSIPDAIAQGAQGAQEYVEESLPVNPLYQNTIGQKVAGVTGQVAGQLGTILTGASITKAPKILQALGLGQAGLLGLESGYADADKYGITEPWKRDALAVSYAAAEAGVEGWSGFGTQSFIKGLLGEARELLTSGAVKKAAKTALGEGIEEPITGTLQAGASNVFAEEDPARPGFTINGQPLPSLDPTSPEFLSARGEEFALGAFGGSLFAGAQYLGSRPKVEQAKKLKQKVDLAVDILSQNPNPTPEEQADLAELQARQAELDTVIPQSEAALESTTMTAQVAGAEEPVDAVDPDTALTAKVVAEEPEPETPDEITSEAPITEALVETADSAEPGSEAAVELPSDLPAVEDTTPGTEPAFVAPDDEVMPPEEVMDVLPEPEVSPPGVASLSEAQVEEAWLASPEFTQAEELAAAGDLEAAEAVEASFREKQASATDDVRFLDQFDLQTSERLVRDARAGDERSKNEGKKRPEGLREPVALVELPLSLFSDETREFIRTSTRPDRVERYVTAKPETPIYALRNKKDGTFRISDGGHRLMAAIERGDSHIRAYVPLSSLQQKQTPGPTENAPQTIPEGKETLVANARAVVESQKGAIPAADDAWVGTRAQILTDPTVRREFVENEMALDPTTTKEAANAMFDEYMGNPQMEGVTFGGKTYIVADNVDVTEVDGTFEEAIKRLLRHEDTHISIDTNIQSNPKLKKEWEGLKKRISPAKLDDLAQRRYPELSDWRNDTQAFNDLAHEYFAEQMEYQELGQPVDDEDLLRKFIAFMRKVLARVMGRDVSIKEIREFVRAGRDARARARQMESTARASQQNIFPADFGVPEMPEGSVKLITHESPYPGMTSEKIAAYAWPRFYAAWTSNLENPDAPLTNEQRTQLEADWKANLADENAMEIAADNAFSEERMSKANFGLYSPEPSQTAPETGQARFSLKPTYGSQSEERKAEYDEAVAAIPESGRDYVQFLGSLTRTPKVAQAVRPMVDFARSLMGSYQGDEIEVNAENTERVKELAAQAFQKGKSGAQFAEDISEQFRNSGFSDNGRHQGSVMAGVLQMEILDYAVRLAGEGDKSLALALMPYANDVARADHATLSNSARAMQLQSLAGQQKGFWTILNSLAKGERELAEKNPIYKELREALFSDEVQAETAAAVEKDLASEEGQRALDLADTPEDLLDTYLGRALGIMDQAERDITIKLFTDMSELEFLLAKQEAMQAPKGAKASMKAAREMNDPTAIQQRIDELKKNISKGLKALDQFKTSEATKETRKKALNKTPRAKKALSADAEAKKMLDRLENKDKRTKKEPAPWKKSYADQIQNPKSEAEFSEEMAKHGVSKEIAQKLFDAAETASAEISKKSKEKARQAEKGPAQAFSAWVGGAEQDGIEDFVDLVSKNITATGFNETGFRQALANKFDKVDQDLIDATTEQVIAKLEEQENEEKKTPKAPDYDARAKRLVTESIAKKSGAEQSKLKDPMTEAIKSRMKGDIDAAGLKGRLLSLGIEPETVFAVGKKVEEDLSDRAQEDAKRKAKTLAEKLAREAAKPAQTADAILDQLDFLQTEAQIPAKKKDEIRELARKARKDEGRGQRLEWFNEYQQKFEALGVPTLKAQILTSRLWQENQKERANRVLRQRESASASKTFINSVMKSIFDATLEEQSDPQWRRQTMEQAFRSRGFTEEGARKAADWLEYRFNTHLSTAQEKAARKAAKELDMKKPTLEKLVKAIRSKAIDPLNADPVTKALAAEAGFAGITPEQFTELAKLDGQMRGPYQSQRAKAAARMLDIALAAKPPKSRAQILTQAWVASALSSLSTTSLSAIHALFIPARRVLFDIAGIAGDRATGKISTEDAAALIGNTFDNLIEAASNMKATVQFAGRNDSYTQHIVQFVNEMHSMKADFRAALEVFKDKNATPAQRTKAGIKMAFTSTDAVRRVLSTADETWGSMLQDFILRNEAMRTLVKKGNLSPTAAAMLFTQASRIGQDAAQKHLNETGNQVEAQLIARDASQNALLEAVRTTVSEEAAKDVEETASLESPMELGNRKAEEAPIGDVVNLALEWVKTLGITTRLKSELLGRMITGFVTVPANVLNRSLAFTPAGVIRALYKQGKFNSMPKFLKWLQSDPDQVKKSYNETMRTEGQQRMRMIEGLAGSVLMMVLAALMSDDGEDGLVITGIGPEEQGLKEAWAKKGHGANRIEWVDKKGNVRFSIPYARGGFDHMNLMFALLGAKDDMRLKGVKPKGKNVEYGTQFAHTLLNGVLHQAKFFGLKNLAGVPTLQMTNRSLASQGAYFAAPFVPWSGLTKSLGRMYTGPTDQSSVYSAIISQMPVTSFFGSESLNALGDQRGPAPTDAAWDRAVMSGSPWMVGAYNKGPDEDLYTMMISRGIAPTVPARTTLERVNGFLSDQQWEQYLKTRGALIKQGIRRNLRTFRKLPYQDAQNLMERISADSTRAAKAKLQLE